jgi:hypothetical protein
LLLKCELRRQATMTSHALKNFDQAPPQKFGTQAKPPPKVKIYACGEKHDKGTDFLVKHYRTLEQFEKDVAQKCRLMPSLRGLFTVDGRKITSLDEIENRQILVAVKSGTMFSRERLPSALLTTATTQNFYTHVTSKLHTRHGER